MAKSLIYLNLAQPNLPSYTSGGKQVYWYAGAPITGAYYNNTLYTGTLYLGISASENTSGTITIDKIQLYDSSKSLIGEKSWTSGYQDCIIEVNDDFYSDMASNNNPITYQAFSSGANTTPYIDYDKDTDSIRIKNPYAMPTTIYKDNVQFGYSEEQTGYNNVTYLTWVASENGTYYAVRTVKYSDTWSWTSKDVVVTHDSTSEVVYYTVTFDSNGGSNVDSKKVIAGGTISEPTPTRTNYTFKGWYTNPSLTTAYDFSTAVTSNFTLYAKWEARSERYVRFFSFGELVSSQTVIYGETVTPPTDPTATNYDFLGWSLTNKEGATLYDFSTAITDDTTLYAVWRRQETENVIIIPSRHIYEITNEKVRSNAIDRIDVSAYEVKPDNDFNTSVYNDEMGATSDITTYSVIDSPYVDTIRGTTSTIYKARLASTIQAEYAYKQIPTIKIKKLDYNKRIRKLYTDSDNIYYNIASYLNSYEGNVTYTPKTNTYKRTKGSSSFPLVNESKTTNFTDITIDETSLTLSKTNADNAVTVKYKIGVENNTISGYVAVQGGTLFDQSYNNNATAKFELPLAITENMEITEDSDYYIINKLQVLTKLSIFWAYVWLEDTSDISSITGDVQNDTMHGFEIETIPESLQLTLYGDTVAIALSDKSVVVGNENGTSPFSITGNELLQTSNYSTLSSGNPTTNMLSSTLEEYKKGKETATVVCSISDYYNDNGDKVITSDGSNDNRMFFKTGDIVIPQVYRVNKITHSLEDSPMSKYNDGTAKQFNVLGVRLYDDGVVRQELTLQERKLN